MLSGFIHAQTENLSLAKELDVYEMDNTCLKHDKFWRRADGAASIDLENEKILWLFSDTFIDTKGTGKRTSSKMINNSIAIQGGYELQESNFSFYFKGTNLIVNPLSI